MVSVLFRSLSFFFLFSYFNLSSSELLEQKYQERASLFKSGTQDRDLEGHTKEICTLLLAPEALQALDTDPLAKKRAIKAVIANVLLHQSCLTEEDLYCFSSASEQDTLIKKLRLMDKAARVGFAKYQKSEPFRNWKDIGPDICTLAFRLNLSAGDTLTFSFIPWFYETIEEHFTVTEWSFFGGSATQEWFQEVCAQYAAEEHKLFTSNLFTLITSTTGKPIAVYKRKDNVPSDNPDRNLKEESICWLIAKAAGVDDVVNPVLPVRVVKGTQETFIIDPYNPDGTLEPFAALVEQEEGELEKKYGELGSFIKRLAKELESPGDTADLGAVHLNASYNVGRWQVYSPYLNFIEHCLAQTRDINGIRLIAEVIKEEDLAKMVIFWHLTLQTDMNPGNIIWVPTTDGRLRPKIFDYDLCWGKRNTRQYRIPLIYVLHQAGVPLSDTVSRLFDNVDLSSIARVLARYGGEGGASFEQVQQRNVFLKVIAGEIKKRIVTLRQIMTDIVQQQRLYDTRCYFDPYWKLCRRLGFLPLDPSQFHREELKEFLKRVQSSYGRHRSRIDLTYLDEALQSSQAEVMAPTQWIFSTFEEERLRAGEGVGFLALLELNSYCLLH